MRKVLRKRLPRDLRENLGRYIALILLIVMGIYLVVGIVGSAEVVLRGTEDMRSVGKTEDGQFTVFLPLTDDELSKLTSDGTIIEEMFYTDLSLNDTQTLRLFKNRENIDLIQLKEGRLAEDYGEAVLERRFAEVNDISLGDVLDIGNTKLTIVGIGSVPDYDQTLQSFSDTAVQSEQFGLLFVTGKQYEDIRDNSSQVAEEYTYSYLLGKGTTDAELKEEIKELDFDYTKVENEYFRQTIDEILEDRQMIEDGLDELYDGSIELHDGMTELDSHSEDLRTAADDLFNAYLASANQAISVISPDIALTEDNYDKTLDELIALTASSELEGLKASLDSLMEFKNGIYDYTGGVNEAAEGTGELYDGVSDAMEDVDELLDEIFDIDIDNLTNFITADDNIRIEAAAGDVIMDKNGGLIAGVIILILFAYVISVFVVHQIEREASVIGALYALGVKKKELLRHYITLPTIVAFIGGVIGTALGFSPIGIGTQTADTYNYFSLPEYDIVYPIYLLVYALILPPVISAIVNVLVINKKLSQTALSLIKNEQKAGSYRQINIKGKSFPHIFRTRQMLREARSAATVVLGMLISLLVVTLGLDCYVMCNAVKRDNVADTKYEYMYYYKYPDSKVPDGGEAAYIESLSTDCMGYTLDVTVIGIDDDNRFFDAKPKKGKNKIVINNSLVERYGYKAGDKVIFTDLTADMDYAFTVTDSVEYAPGFTIFMDIDSMRELFGADEDYFNVVYSDRELNIENGRLYSITTKSDIKKSAGVFIDQMSSLIYVLIIAGSIIFCVVMYLMMNVMIDRSSYGISLVKIFGYRPKEIRQLYLNGNFAIVAIGALICIPAAKLIMNKVYPMFIPNIACTMKLSFPWYIYLSMYIGILIIYFIVNALLTRKINKITPAEVLKNRE
ncbi:MAG: FtsX-like permease family protein [Lachnospiraceae bacterium]|nr:FtsX-like permease family protein [Lachnospiraceae bacterium]